MRLIYPLLVFWFCLFGFFFSFFWIFSPKQRFGSLLKVRQAINLGITLCSTLPLKQHIQTGPKFHLLHSFKLLIFLLLFTPKSFTISHLAFFSPLFSDFNDCKYVHQIYYIQYGSIQIFLLVINYTNVTFLRFSFTCLTYKALHELKVCQISSILPIFIT